MRAEWAVPAIAFILGTGCNPVVAETYGAFATSAERPGVLLLDGPIEGSLPLDFRRAIRSQPDTRVLVLNSPGGVVDAALVVAHEIREKGIATYIPPKAGCYSACAYLYLAGVSRRADGELGVHQLYSDTNDLGAGQTILSDILEALDEFGTPQAVISRMLRTPPDKIYVFPPSEIAGLGLNVGEPIDLASAIEQARTPLEGEPPVNIVRDLGPENLTVVPMTRQVGQEDASRAERMVEVRAATELAPVLLANGFTAQTAEMMTGTLAAVLPTMRMPAGTMLRILFGPSRASDTLIPYRLSVYFPDSTGELRHATTAALTDRGSYVLGSAPRTITFGGRRLWGSAPAGQPDLGLPGKRDRLR